MLNMVKREVAQMLETLLEAMEQMLIGNISIGEVEHFIKSINNEVKSESEEFVLTGEKLIHVLKLFLENNNDVNIRAINKIYKSYIKLFNDLPTQYKVVFLPYYESTWDSLESVWEAFKNDPAFITQITITPINRNIGAETKMIYKDYLTPKGIPHVPYDVYSFEKDKPDIVFTNQPYDGVSLPKFMSQNIRPHVGMLVYIPYFTYMHTNYSQADYIKELERYTELSVHDAADLIITNGIVFNNAFKKRSKNGYKMIALGSPKNDLLFKCKNSISGYNKFPEWEKKIKGKITFMLNTHYDSLFDCNKLNNTPAWLTYLIDYIKNDGELALIWRPHPLTFDFLDKMPQSLRKLFDMIRSGRINNIILDESENASSAFMYCNAVLSEWSSLISSSIILDKPTFSLHLDPFLYQENQKNYYDPRYDGLIKKSKQIVKGSTTYHAVLPSVGAEKHLQSDETVDEIMYRKPLIDFINAIKAGEDPKGELRKHYIDEHAANPDGTCGKAILKHIKKKIRNFNV